MMWKYPSPINSTLTRGLTQSPTRDRLFGTVPTTGSTLKHFCKSDLLDKFLVVDWENKLFTLQLLERGESVDWIASSSLVVSA